ncbi:MAG: tripartite tricarboxylate transporter substrate binding protein [Firmicutes bacterium]|nr:tripartite tricarboxylate transporter substrate binding protein [Bacillota bacterium]MDH7494756.1 tripartite tricarboxylate transporter substrate binding protein [Bacillota bacterium]
MRRNVTKLLGLALLLVIVWTVGTSAFAQGQFPTKPIRIIVPYAAGGGTDLVARRLAQDLEKILGVNVVVANVVGGSGAIGRAEAAKAPADGYTLFMDDKAFLSSYHMGVSTVNWRDMEPVCRLDGASFVLVVSSKSQFKTINDLIDYAKKNPGVVTIAVSGIGGVSHLNAEAIKIAGNVNIVIVPFEGGAMTRTAVAGGHVTATVAQIAEIYSFVKAGDFRILAVSDDKRNPGIPDVPTFRESGVNFSLDQWRGIYAPKGTPTAIIERLEKAFQQAMETEGFKGLCAQNFTRPLYLDHKAFAAELENTDAILKDIVTKAGLLKK